MSLNPKQVFVVRSFTREEIAKEFNNVIDADGLKIEPFKEDDVRLTDEVCEAFVNACDEAVTECDDVVDKQHENHSSVLDLYFG